MAITPKKNPTLAERIRRARAEVRTQTALELARELARKEPTLEHQQLLRDVTIERGEQLLSQGKERDAVVVLGNALNPPCDVAIRLKVAAKLARAGAIAEAWAALEGIPDGPERNVVLGHIADAALARRDQGRACLPAELQAGHDAIVRAAEQLHRGEDEVARDSLQAIGLQSPFLEWRVLLRGLSAFHQKDDARARDNWQRLDPQRLPWRLAAPLRMLIDAAFRELQPHETRRHLQQTLDRTVGAGPAPSLRTLEELLAKDDERALGRAFRVAEGLLPGLRQTNPDVAARLERILYAAVAARGDVEDIPAFRRVVPPPADDPHLHLLEATVAERRKYFVATTHWLAYENDVRNLPERFPGEVGTCARALIWAHLGQVVQSIRASLTTDDEDEEDLDEVLDDIPKSELCYRNSIALAPGRKEGYRLLLAELQANDAPDADVLAVARELLARFPDDVDTWQLLGNLACSGGDFQEAMRCFREAMTLNPLRSDLRQGLIEATWKQGWHLGLAAGRKRKTPADPAAFRALLEEAFRQDESDPTARLASWAVLEERLGHADKAQELLDRIRGLADRRIALPLAIHVAAQFLGKLAVEVTKGYVTALEQALRKKPSPREQLVAVETLAALANLHARPIKGATTLVNRLFPRVTPRDLAAYSREELLRLGQALVPLKQLTLLRMVAVNAGERFEGDPYFALLEFDLHSMQARRGRAVFASYFLEDARRAAETLPPRERDKLLAEIARRKEALEACPSLNIVDFFHRHFGDFR